jgi:hypothetical protein
MINKRNADEVLKSIFNLIKDAKKELNTNSKTKIEEKEGFAVRNITNKEKIDSIKKIESQKKQNSRYSNLNNISFKKIDFNISKKEFSEVQANDGNEMKFEKLLSETFQSEIDKWQRKNLKKIVDLVFDEYSKEKLKKNLK